MNKLVSRCLLRLRGRAPFFAVLALHARWVPDETIATAATDGRTVLYNPRFLEDLEPSERDFVVAHEVAHLALRHVRRRGLRDPLRWNLACDIVVNGILIASGLQPPVGIVRDRALEDLRAEDVYARIHTVLAGRARKFGDKIGHGLRDLAERPGSPQDEAWWRDALRKAAVAQRVHGTQALAASRELGAVLEPALDWRTLLWRHLVRSPTYRGFDRRFVHQGLYLDALDGERVDVRVCIDTSGSVSGSMLDDFVAELRGIAASHPALRLLLWYADTRLYGPHELTPESELPSPMGGGGTDLRPFFGAVDEQAHHELSGGPPVAVYLTDGFGPMPSAAPPYPVLWVIPDGGVATVPWGELARIPTRS